MKATPRTAASGKRRATPEPSHRASDLLGVASLAFAGITGISLATSDNGVLGGAVAEFFRVLFGQGAWGVPVVFGLLGIGLLAGRRSNALGLYGGGLALIFLTVLGVLAQPLNGDYFDPQVVKTGGGYLGAMVGWVFAMLLGQGKLVGLGALGMVGLILCLQMPIRAVLESAAERAASLRKKPANQAVVAKPTPTRPVSARTVVLDPGSVREAESARSGQRALDLREQEPAPIPKPKPIIRDHTAAAPAPASVEPPATPKEGYTLPPVSLLNASAAKPKRTAQEMQRNIETLESTLEQFGIDANVVEVATGPTVTRYEIQLGPGIKVSRITSLADNIAMDLAASHVRVEAPIPGKSAIGVEVPNAQATMVTLREICETQDFKDHPSRLLFALGQDVSGQNKFADMTKMPHLLIGGATNSGKSIGLASIIMSLLMRNTPKDCKMVMIDPKRVELSLFDGVPHLMCPVVKDVKEAPGVLRAVWREMDRRYDLFSDAGVRNIDGWNAKASFADKMPYIVVFIDELADLMIQAAAEVETSICRLAQLARATGIHLVVATQRPSVDVVTGTIKANIASRIAFTVSSQVDSRTILDQAGAERLIGRGDMLFLPIDASKPLRIQGCYVSEKEIEAVCTFWRDQEKPVYQINPAELARELGEMSGGRGGDDDDDNGELDALWDEAVEWVVKQGQASTSMLQRKFKIGFQRASRLLDVMEERGIVGPRDGPRPREVLVNPHELDDILNRGGVVHRYDLTNEMAEE